MFIPLQLLLYTMVFASYRELESPKEPEVKIHYTILAYNVALSNLIDKEYIIKKASEHDGGIQKTYHVTYITNMGNIIYIDFSGKRKGIKFGYKSVIGCMGNRLVSQEVVLDDKIIDRIVDYKFCRNGNGHYSKVLRELRDLIEPGLVLESKVELLGLM